MLIPLEDLYSDILGKAQRGLKIGDADLSARAGISEAELVALKSGHCDTAHIRAVAPILGLEADAVIALAEGSYHPAEISLEGLACFNSPFDDMTVNSYVVWDAGTREAAVIDTGADATEMLAFLATHRLTVKFLLLTHTHGDHILEMDRIVEKTGAPVFVGNKEPALAGAEPFAAGKTFTLGNLTIGTRLTWGHAQGGITFVVQGLNQPLAIVGDAVFAGSMGGGGVSYADALRTNREEIFSLPDSTILACGHGPLTTVGEQKKANPFFACDLAPAANLTTQSADVISQ